LITGSQARLPAQVVIAEKRLTDAEETQDAVLSITVFSPGLITRIPQAPAGS
jgi:hypothetical protein